MTVTGNAGSGPALDSLDQKGSLWAPPFLNLGAHSTLKATQGRDGLLLHGWW